MTLIKTVLQRVKSQNDVQHPTGRYISPPPEINDDVIRKEINRVLKKPVYKYANITARVDSSSPLLRGYRGYHNLQRWSRDLHKLYAENMRLLMLIRQAHYLNGKVDCHWKSEPRHTQQYYKNRVDFMKRIHRDNLDLYKRIISTSCRVTPTSCLNRDWCRQKKQIINRALNAFVLFPAQPHEHIEDPAFAPPPGLKRPRVYMTIGLQGYSALGELCIELFTDICPETCRLFTELIDGDTVGYSYVGTCFFRKVPHLYWSGGDVTRNNGFGCYAQRGRSQPIEAENYNFSHSMPGLLSMRVTRDNEVCGIFNITIKPLPQFDLHNVVFGRIIRPSVTYDAVRDIGSSLNSYPVVEIRSTRRKQNGHWIKGKPNTQLELHSREAIIRRK